METYSLLRQIADSWVLLLMFAFFLGCIFWAFRPNSRHQHDEAAMSIFKADLTANCSKDCASCTCQTSRDTAHD